MKFETLMLHSLFAACMLICLGVISAMLILPAPVTLASAHAATAVAATVG